MELRRQKAEFRHSRQSALCPKRRLPAARSWTDHAGKIGTVVGGLESRILQGALEAGGVAAQQVKSIRAVDCHSRCHVAVAVDIEPDFDAAEFGRIEPDLEAVLAGNRFAGDFDGDAGKWNGRRLRPGLRNQSCGGSGVLRRMRGCAGDG